jgi:haloalkane dehalogenase
MNAADPARTPEQRLERLSGYPYPTTYLSRGDGPRLAYLAEGPSDGHAVLLLHAPPAWSYLWRQVIPMLAEGGCRAVAPDLLGCGRSDRPGADVATLDPHVESIAALVDHLDLRDVTLVAHGAAAPLAWKLLSRERYGRLVAVEPHGGAAPPTDLAPSEQIARGCTGTLSPSTRLAYDAPFADGAGVSTSLADDGAEAGELPPIDKPLLVVTGAVDSRAASAWTAANPGIAASRRHLIVPGAGHYVPEDRGPELALGVLAFLIEKS